MLRTLTAHLRHVKQSHKDRHVVALIIAGALVAMLLSLAIGLRQSVWFDEAYSIMLAKQSVGDLLRLTALDTHPPLYYLLLKGWASVFGWSELALRSFSVLALGGAVTLGGLLVRRLFGARAALLTVAVMAVSPFLLRYGFEIRMYALGSLIGIAATYVLVAARQRANLKQSWWLYAIYAVLVAAGVYTLYYTALLWVAHVVWLVWMSLRNKRSLQRLVTQPWWLALIGAVVLFVPWLPTFLKQVGNGALAPIAQSMTLENLLGIISFNTVYEPIWRLSPVLSLLVLFVLVVLGWLSVRAFRAANAGERSYLLLFVVYLLVPVALLTIVGFMRPMYVERYLAHVAIAFSIFVGVAISLVSRRLAGMWLWVLMLFGVVMIVGVLQLAALGNYNFQRLQKPQVAQAAALIDCHDATVLAADPYVAIELNYYVHDCPVRFYSNDDTLGGGYAPLSRSPLQVREPSTELADASEIYYVYYDKPQLQMPAGHSFTQHTSFGPLTVDQFSAAPRD